MITTEEIARELSEAKHLDGEEKLQAYKRIWRLIHQVEKAATMDMGISLHEIQHVRELLGEVQAGIKRLEAARIKKSTRQNLAY